MPYFTGAHGRVHHHAWLPAGEARSVVVLLHGYGEHLGLYDALGRRLSSDGHAVHALDCVGHGRSDGERASVETWDWYVDDARTLVERARAQHPGLPVFVVGHSGGALARSPSLRPWPTQSSACTACPSPESRRPRAS